MKRWTRGVEVAHFGPQPLKNAVAIWKLVADDGKVLAHGELPAKTIPVDNGIALGNVSVDLKNAQSAGALQAGRRLSAGTKV